MGMCGIQTNIGCGSLLILLVEENTGKGGGKSSETNSQEKNGTCMKSVDMCII